MNDNRGLHVLEIFRMATHNGPAWYTSRAVTWTAPGAQPLSPDPLKNNCRLWKKSASDVERALRYARKRSLVSIGIGACRSNGNAV